MRPGPLVAGVLFIALGILFLLDTLGTVDLQTEVLLAVLLIALGGAVIFSARGRS